MADLSDPPEKILELAEKVIALTGSTSQMIRKPLPADDPLQRQPDISFARRTIGWEPKIQLEEGLKRTIAYFETLLGAEAGPRRAVRRPAKRPAAPRRAGGKRPK